MFSLSPWMLQPDYIGFLLRLLPTFLFNYIFYWVASNKDMQKLAISLFGLRVGPTCPSLYELQHLKYIPILSENVRERVYFAKSSQ